MAGQIKLSAFKDPEVTDGSLQFCLFIRNHISSTFIYFYDFPDCFKAISSALSVFPQTPEDSIRFAIGTDDEASAYYIALEAFCYEEAGQSAIHVLIDNHEPDPDYCRTEFFIPCTHEAINRLGKILNDWDPNATGDVVWDAEPA